MSRGESPELRDASESSVESELVVLQSESLFLSATAFTGLSLWRWAPEP